MATGKNQEKEANRKALFLTALKTAGIETDQEEYHFHDTRKWRFDFAWVSAKLAVELDGGTWGKYGGRHNGDADREKLNEAACLGWRLLRFSGAQIEKDPVKCAEYVKRALDK